VRGGEKSQIVAKRGREEEEEEEEEEEAGAIHEKHNAKEGKREEGATRLDSTRLVEKAKQSKPKKSECQTNPPRE
jgi:hypothetical protein